MPNNCITLTETKEDDLNAFFQFQLDKEANYLAAFTSKDSNDKSAYIAKHAKFIIDPTINMRTIKVDDVRRVAFDNFGSQKFLEKCGFVKIGKEQGFANARQEVIEEYVYKLSD